MRYVRNILIFLALVGCAPSTLQEVRWEAEAEMRRLALELKDLSTREEVQKAVPRLRRRYLRIANLAIQVERWKGAPVSEPSQSSEELFIELARLYEIPGARELIESAQQEAIALLDRSR